MVIFLLCHLSNLIKEFHSCDNLHTSNYFWVQRAEVGLLAASSECLPATKFFAVKVRVNVVVASFSCQAGKACSLFSRSSLLSFGVCLQHAALKRHTTGRMSRCKLLLATTITCCTCQGFCRTGHAAAHCQVQRTECPARLSRP